jgi:two-component system phosphate regulon sensor histidine kinase PhoR
LKYSEGPEPVTVKVTCDDEEMRVDVIDHGAGIVSSDIPHIFERFKQLDSSSTRRHGGTGVGLYLCAQLVRVHGGTITVDSTWGKGSTFTFTIPRRAAGQKVVHMYGPNGRKSA